MYNAPRKPVKARKATVKKPTVKKPTASTVNKTNIHQKYLNWYVKSAKTGKAPSKKQAGTWWEGKATPAQRKRWGV